MTDWSRAPKGYRELRTSAVIVEVPGLSLFRLTGTDAESWLQGQCTNDLRLFQTQDGVDFCLTKPTGQILSLCRAWRREGALIVATDEPDVLLQRIEATVIMEDVSIERLDDPVCVQGPEAGGGGLTINLTGSGGCLVSTPPPGLSVLSLEGWNLSTLECGHPLKGIDFNEKTLPPELGPSFDARYVSYQKGCYTGQEILMRIKSRGHTNKTWVVLRSTDAIEKGATVTFEGKNVGTVHRTAVSPGFGHIATATLKNVASEDGTIVIVDACEARVCVHPLSSES